MKVLVGVLIALLVLLQYRLWFGEGSIQEVSRLRSEAEASRDEVLRLSNRNQALAAEVADLKRGLDAIDERARAELGMIGEGETFYQFVLESGARDNDLSRDESVARLPGEDDTTETVGTSDSGTDSDTSPGTDSDTGLGSNSVSGNNE